MEYPVWYLPTIGGGILIALIAITHVFVSHFAIGGGLFLVFSEKKGYRENDEGVLAYTKRHAKFFLLVTMVFGSMSGVGIWLIISLVQPAATSFLIHKFVFAWAIEWVFFLIEIVAAFVYFYTFGKMDRKTHLMIGWIYFIAAWISLFLINGILTFMLTPGSWVENPTLFAGFFNPSFWPSLFFRTFIATMLAGAYGFLTASFIKDPELRVKMSAFSSKWTLFSFIPAIPAGLWYLSVLPELPKSLVAGKLPSIKTALYYGLGAVILLILLALLTAIAKPKANLKPLAIVTFISAFIFMGAFEYIREGARRPYVLNQVMYSNGILKKDVARLNKEGFLKHAKWTTEKPIGKITEKNRIEAGRVLFDKQCYACHTVNGFNNDIVSRTRSLSYRGMIAYLKKMHQTRPFMPPFVGTEVERDALAAYIVVGLHGKSIPVDPKPSDTNKGKGLYEENCAACHESDDMKELLQGWDLQKIRSSLPRLSELNEEMPDFEGSEPELNALADFLAGLNREGTQPAPIQGSHIFEENCSACHEGDSLNPFIKDKSMKDLLDILSKLNQLNEEMPPFEGSEAEKKALAAYLLTLKGEKK